MFDHEHGHQDGGHRHEHGIGAGRTDARTHLGALTTVLVLVGAFLVVQVVVGLLTDSLAVLSDAGHMATDALGIGMSVAAIAAATRPARAASGSHRTFGWYRLEILAALANSALLVGVGAFVVFEAARRLGGDPEPVASWPVLGIGAAGLAVNVASMLILRRAAAENLNVRGAYLEVVADALGSVAVIVTAVLNGLFAWGWIDPAVGAAIGVFILPRAFRLGRDALRVLVQAAPSHLDPMAVRSALAELEGVTGVHDLHVWTLTSQMDVVTAHLSIGDDTDPHAVLDAARRELSHRFDLTHATLQIEAGTDPCDHPAW